MTDNRSDLRTVLMIAYHYPPCATSSGLQRTLAFSKYLNEFGWRAIVLTVRPHAYERTSDSQTQDILPDVLVKRTTSLDAARHLAFRGKYWSRLAIPDRWSNWWFTAVPAGVRLIRRHRVDAIWSTYPIATAHLIGGTLQRMSGLPWIADFRDPMVEYLPETAETFPKDPVLREARLKAEAKALHRATKLVFCTNAARQIVADRYSADGDTLYVISNGYEERAFEEAEILTPIREEGRRLLLHSGTIYPGRDRDPTPLFKAIRTLADRRLITPDNFELRLRDPSNEHYYKKLANEIGIADLVSILSPLPYRSALAEMLSADALLLLQGYTSNPAVPAKLYEYLRARRTILALVHPLGETAATLRALGIDTHCPLDNVGAITTLLERWVRTPRELSARLPCRAAVAQYSRRRLTAQLGGLLDSSLVAKQRTA